MSVPVEDLLQAFEAQVQQNGSDIISFEEAIKIASTFGIYSDLQKVNQFRSKCYLVKSGFFSQKEFVAWLRADQCDKDSNNFQMNKDLCRSYVNLNTFADGTQDMYTQGDAHMYSKNVDVNIGQQYIHPLTSATFKYGFNSTFVNPALYSLPAFDSYNGLYLYLTFKSNNPYQLKSGLEEFFNVAMSMMREAMETFDHAFKGVELEYSVSGDTVVVAWDFSKTLQFKLYGEIATLVTSRIVRNEISGQVGVQFDSSIEQLITQTKIDSQPFRIYFENNSTKGDKLMFSRFLNWLSQSNHTIVPEKGLDEVPEDQIHMKLLFYILRDAQVNHSFHNLDQLKEFDQKLYDVLRKELSIQEMIGILIQFYSKTKPMIEQFPFIQQLIDTLQQYGEDRVEIGVNHRQSTMEIQLSAPETSILYNKITQ